MKENEYKQIEIAMDKAEESTVPFPVVDGDVVAVVGDANETQKNAHDFEIVFRVPQNTDEGVKYKLKSIEYKDVFITPRMDGKVVKAITTIIPYFKKVNIDGSVESLTDEEKIAIFDSFDDEFYDAMYDVVSAVLGIDKELKDYMMPGSVLKATAKIIKMFPETVNEADTFFG